VENFLKAHPNLHTLKAAHLSCATENVLLEISRHPQLRALDLSAFYTDSYYFPHEHIHKHDIAQGLKAIAKMRELKTLDLNHNDFVNDETLFELAVHACGLEDLNLSKLIYCTKTGFKSLGALQNLKRLDIGNNEAISDDVILSLVTCSSLEFVEARNCRLTGVQTLKSLAEIWPNRSTVFQVF